MGGGGDENTRWYSPTLYRRELPPTPRKNKSEQSGDTKTTHFVPRKKKEDGRVRRYIKKSRSSATHTHIPTVPRLDWCAARIDGRGERTRPFVECSNLCDCHTRTRCVRETAIRSFFAPLILSASNMRYCNVCNACMYVRQTHTIHVKYIVFSEANMLAPDNGLYFKLSWIHTKH